MASWQDAACHARRASGNVGLLGCNACTHCTERNLTLGVPCRRPTWPLLLPDTCATAVLLITKNDAWFQAACPDPLIAPTCSSTFDYLREAQMAITQPVCCDNTCH
jgi:hypothetical protein